MKIRPLRAELFHAETDWHTRRS